LEGFGNVDRSLEIAAALCRRFEGFSATPYLCPAGYWTIGYGTVFKPDGTQVTKDDPPITKEVAEQWLQHELRHNYRAGVLKASPSLINHPEVLGALTDFAYNLGVSRYRASTLRKRINEGDWEGAKTELGRWVRGGGRVLRGLVLRRQAEAKLLG
jgi:lysozyme